MYKKRIRISINYPEIMDELELIKHRRATEHQFGDVRKACESVGVSPTVFQSALKKTLVDDLTDKEILVIRAFTNLLDERKTEKEALKKSLLSK
jgi:prolyl-tRNA editing enzyme YbaK/EbsC (Cys-tRNA(Pro) deacylase)